MRNANRTILVSIAILILEWLLPFQLNSGVIQKLTFGLILFSLTVAICWKVLKMMEKNGDNLVVRAGIILILAFVMVCICGFMWLGNLMCAYSMDRVLFQNRDVPNLKIVGRSYGCGAQDSQMAEYEIFKVRPIGSWITYVSKTDTARINRSEWIPVK